MNQKIKEFIKEIEKYESAEKLIKGYKPNGVKKVIDDLNKDTDNNKSRQGFIYEKLWDICIKLGITDLTDKDTKHGIGNFNIKNKEEFKTIDKFFDTYIEEKVISGNSGGYSDITFENVNENKKTLNLVSVKYIKGKSIIDFDIQNLCTIIKDREKEYRDKNKDDIDMENYEIKTLLFVKNKGEFIELCKKANKSSNLLIKYISPNGNYENVYDFSDLEVYYKELKKLLDADLYNYWKNEQCIDDFKKQYLNFKKKIKPPFIPRFHQELFIEKINAMINRFSNTENKQILVGAIPRSGKTYIMAGTILRHVKEHIKKELKSGITKKTFNNYVIITPSPNETQKQYKEAFDDHIDFEKYDIEADIIRAENAIVFDKNKDKHFVYLISKQRLENIKDDDPDDSKYEKKGDVRAKKYEDNIKKYFGEKDIIKIIFMDEAHFGMSTEIAQKIVNCLKTSNSIKIFVTATYNKPQNTYGVDDKHLIKWDLDDILMLKNMSTEGLEKSEVIKHFRNVLDQFSKKFGENILKKVLKNNGWDWYDILQNELFSNVHATVHYTSQKVLTKVLNRNKTIIDNIRKQYRYFPEPYMITSVWDDEFFEEQKKLLKGKETNYGFDMGKLFQLQPDNNTSFVNKEQLTQLFQYYFGYPDKKKSYYIQNQYKLIGILPRIERICNNNCRTLQTPLHKTTQLWFLPPDNIAKTINALLYFLEKEFGYIFKKYKFYIGVLEVETDKFPEHPNVKYMEDPQKIKSEIYEEEQNIKDSNDYDGLIILVGKRLQLGISLENVDIVSLFTNIKASDAIYQMIFRSMTEIDDGMKCNGSSFCSNKKYGFMVDLDPQRTIYTLEYLADRTSSNNGNDDNDETYTKRRIADLINIDKDKFVNKYDTTTDNSEYVKEFFDKLYHSWDAKTENIKNILKNENILDNINIKELLKVDISSLFKYKKDKGKGKDAVVLPKNAISPGKMLEFKDLFKKQTKKRGKAKAGTDIDDADKNKDDEMLLYDIISETISILTFISSYSNLECIFSKDKIKDFKYEILKIFDELNDDQELKEIYIYYLKKRIVRKEAIIAIADEKIAEFNEKLFEKVYEIIKSINKKQNKSNGQSGGHIGINKLIHMRKEKIYNIKEPRKLLEFINENLSPKETEKKDRGEVFTPMEIVNEMLDALPKELWVNTEFKWLDPAAGMGNFPVAVYERLMDKLILQIPNEEERRKHILEEMLYMVEFDKANVFMMKKIFCGTTYKLNIFEGSFIDGDDYIDNGIDIYGSNIKLRNENNKRFIEKVKSFDNKFDVIMGNPPYNKDGAGKGGGVFWKSFVYKSLEILRNNGYILMIHPTGWRKPVSMRASAGDIWELFKKYNLIFLKITDEKIPHFPKVDYYVLKKSTIQQDTKVVNQFEKNPSTTSSVSLYNLPFIPHLINNEVISIMNKLLKKKGGKFDIKRNQTIKPKKGILNNSGIPHARYYDINTKKYQEVLEKYLNKPDYILTPKIIMTYSGGKTPANLYAKYFSKEIGVTDNTMYQIITKKDNINNLITFLNSRLIHFILKITQYSSAPNYKNEFNILNMFAKPNEGTITTDEDVYNYYKLTKNERSLINKIIGDYKGAKSLSYKKQKVVKIRHKSLGGKV